MIQQEDRDMKCGISEHNVRNGERYVQINLILIQQPRHIKSRGCFSLIAAAVFNLFVRVGNRILLPIFFPVYLNIYEI